MSRQYYDDPHGSSRRINASSRRYAPATSDFVSHSTFQPNRQRYSSSLSQPVPPPSPPTYYPSSYGRDSSSYNTHANPRRSSVNRLNHPTDDEVHRRYVLETPPSHSRVSQYPQPQPQSYNNDYYHSPRYQSSSHHSNQDNYSRHERSSDQHNRRDRREDPQSSRSYPIQSQRRSIDVPILRQSSTSSRPVMPLQVRNQTPLLAQFLQSLFGGRSTPFRDDDDEGVNRSVVNPVDFIAFALMSPGSGVIAIPSAIHIQFGDFLDLLAHDEPPAVGLSENEIKHIPITTYRKANKSKSEEEKCAVCLSNYTNGEKVKRLRCKHIFHPDCIDPWLKTSTQCPICRGSQSN